MSEEKFTQGRWRVRGQTVRWKAPEPFCPDNLLNGLICKCVAPDGEPEAKEEVIANANLIAAAPKMYTKLKTVLLLCESNLLRKTRCDVLGKEINELLKKARGEE